jgi:hypothetical protein
MKPLFITALVALSIFGSSLGAQAQVATSHGTPATGKIFVDGCIIGQIPDTQP